VIFGKKRWIIYREDEEDPGMARRMALEDPDDSWRDILPTPEWIRRLYPDPWRTGVIRERGMDCVQHAGTMMFVPRGWVHMVVNIGDTVSVISEVGLDKGEGLRVEDFLVEPPSSSDDREDDEDEDEDGDGGYGGKGRGKRGPPPGGRGRGPLAGRGRGPPPPSEDSSDDDYEDSEDE
jgi:hypothetical protein